MTNPTPVDRERIGKLSAKGNCRRYHGADCSCWESGYRSSRDTCRIDDCTSIVKGRGLCAKHYMRWAKYGDPEWTAYSDPQSEITYTTAHQRVAKRRGPATDHPCVDCGAGAHEWSYIGGCPREQRNTGAYDSPYSPDPARYEPRCRGCHRAFDQQQRMECQ